MPEKEVLDLKPALRPEQVGDQGPKQLNKCRHRAVDALILPHRANPGGMEFSGTTVANANP